MTVTKEQIKEAMDIAYRDWLNSFINSDEHEKSIKRIAFEAGYQAGRTDGYRAGMVTGADWRADRHWR